MKLEHVLQYEEPAEVDLFNYRADELKKIAKFWVGDKANKFRKDESLKALIEVFKKPSAMRDAVEYLPQKEQDVLGIFARLGPTVPGYLLSAELHARGFVKESQEPPTRRYYGSYRTERNDVATKLRDKLLLVSSGSYYDRYHYSSYYAPYPTLTLHPKIRDGVSPLGALAWKSSQPALKTSNVKPAGFRTSAEMALDLWQVAEALMQMGKWPTLKDGGLSKASKNKLSKLVGFPAAEENPLVPPDHESLCYELLESLGVLDLETPQVRGMKLEQSFQLHAALQARQWVRAWSQLGLWQDGIGQVSNRGNRSDSSGIDSDQLCKSRNLLVWALCRVAHTSNDWLDLETFLCDFYQNTQHDGTSFYWGNFYWGTRFSRSQGKEKLKDEERRLAYWLDRDGQWSANVLWVSLWMLGLIERGHSTGKAACPCFRLTQLGREVFGAPEVEVSNQTSQKPCLTVQPNNEVVAYLESADARQICRLARFADRTSASGPVQTFQLTRETIYRGLESGLTAEEIQSFLTEHSRTPVPTNVARQLSEWAGKRESLTLRTGISLALAPNKSGFPKQKTSHQIADGAALLPAIPPAKAKQDFEGWQISDHQGSLAKGWTINEQGELKTKARDSLSQARLALIAEERDNNWHITEQSVTRAKSQGITAEQILGWLAAHLTHSLPPLMETAIRNWTGRAAAYFGQVHLLQVTREQARDALLTSAAFKPLLAGHIPPDWFLINKSQLAEVKRLLKQIGFTLTDSYKLPPPPDPTSPPEKPKPARKKKRRRT